MSKLIHVPALAVLAITMAAGQAHAGEEAKVSDPHQWLEGVEDPKALEWVKAQNAKAEAEIVDTDSDHIPLLDDAIDHAPELEQKPKWRGWIHAGTFPDTLAKYRANLENVLLEAEELFGQIHLEDGGWRGLRGRDACGMDHPADLADRRHRQRQAGRRAHRIAAVERDAVGGLIGGKRYICNN